MAGDMFLKIGDLQGESTDGAKPSHQNEIDIIGWSFGATNPASWALGQGGQQSKPTFTDIHISKYCDKASMALWNACATGKHFAEGKITCRKAAGDDNKVEYLKITLTDVVVTSVQFNGSGSEQYLHESITLTSAKVKQEYSLQQEATGSAGGASTFTYDLQKQTNK
jgi:type VI secretion system secreted protein Hcp